MRLFSRRETAKIIGQPGNIVDGNRNRLYSSELMIRWDKVTIMKVATVLCAAAAAAAAAAANGGQNRYYAPSNYRLENVPRGK